MNKTINQPPAICAIDASTNSLAFAFYSYKTLTQYGKINFEGDNIYQKVLDACAKVKPFFDPRKNCSACLFQKNNSKAKELSNLKNYNDIDINKNIKHINFP